ncbi:conserved protein of unknown function [Bradyrhizobium sp. ORS 285]|uniref:hypothetical protein n=1 Tax=Bradyrhizobium sp. ORS 285 TaxID=115808 RepID=UPI000240A03F|nr:hypothetical protein [Bradyrhizobium sp. ORS 285]CCD86998.1 conserved hypothetical protein [Bradyrhizobium sp. ORS 285]SMX57687.1 conserved protein of unknown function [Bradyrhizobium sp. ORS 285]
MRAESVGGALGAIVAAAVLAAAFYYVPVGPMARPAQPAKVEVPQTPVQTVPVAPAVRGPVVREVPN